MYDLQHNLQIILIIINISGVVVVEAVVLSITCIIITNRQKMCEWACLHLKYANTLY